MNNTGSFLGLIIGPLPYPRIPFPGIQSLVRLVIKILFKYLPELLGLFWEIIKGKSGNGVDLMRLKLDEAVKCRKIPEEEYAMVCSCLDTFSVPAEARGK